MNNQRIKEESPMVYLSVGQLREIIKRELELALEAKEHKTLNQTNKELFIIPEAAMYLKISEPTLRVYLRNRDITGSRLGKRWLFTQKNLDDFMERFLVPSIHDLREQGRIS